MLPKVSRFHYLIWALSFLSFNWSFSPAHLAKTSSSHLYLTSCLKDQCRSHIFSNLKGVGPSLNRSISSNKGQWFDTGRGSPFKKVFRNLPSHWIDAKNQSILLQAACALKFDQIYCSFLVGMSIKAKSATHSWNFLVWRLDLLLPFLSL